MRFIGADLHKKSITFCVVEKHQDTLRVVKRQRLMCCEVHRIEAFLKSQMPYQLTVEATIGYEWFAGLAELSAERVVLAHAGKLRIIAESTRKTDKIDAYVLAEFLAHNMIPEAWRPTPRVRQHRALIRRRCKVQSRITSIKNTARGVLTRYNQDRANLFSVAGRFKNGAAVVSYAGLDPGVRDSDGRRKGLKITKAGSPLLRWVMIQLAHRMKRTSRWGRVFEQISRRAGKKKATVAMARRLLTVIFAMLRDGREYQMAAA